MIKKYWKKVWFFSFLASIVFWNLTFANEFDVTNYEVNADIRIDGTIDVNEKIDVNFYQYMHGIERFFPKFYDVGDLEFQILYNNIKVNSDNYQNFDEYNEVYTRVWDADKTIIWEHQYNIDYTTYGLIRNFSWMWYSELYWNVIWYDWWNNINKVKIQISLPKSYTWFTEDDFLISAGYSYESNEDFWWEISWDENNIYITYDKNLHPYEWITLAVKFPNDYFEYDHERQASLFVGYTRDYDIEKYKISWTIQKDGNVKFQDEIELNILNENPFIRWLLPYRYQADGNPYLVKLKDIIINWTEISWDEYDTSNSYKIVYPEVFSWKSSISADYSVYGLIRPFSGDFSDWTYNSFATSGDFDEWRYRLYLKLPMLDLNEKIKNLEINLDIPGGCSAIYLEDIYLNLWNWFINLNEFTENYGSIWCNNDKLMLVYSWEIDNYENIQLNINFVRWTFDLDEDLLDALANLGNWDFYYKDKMNTPSRIFLIWMLIFGGRFGIFMNRRYNSKCKNDKYIVQYDAPKWVEPPEAGILIDDKLDPKDITSLIYRWASNRYIKICAEDSSNKKFYIKKLKDLPKDTKEYEKNLFKKIFSNGDDFYFSANKNKFTTYLTETEKELTKYIDGENRFKTTLPNVKLDAYSFKSWTKSWIFWIAVLWCVGYGFIVTWINETLNSVRSWMKFIFRVWLIWIICSYRKKEKEQWTKKWIEFRRHCLWYKEFLEKVDKKKIEELTRQDPLFVEKSLPYAVVFGIETQFIKKITPEMLSWYDGDMSSLLSSVNYISNFARTSSYSSFGGYSSSGGYSYSSSSWHSWGSSFSSGWFHSWWGWGGWGWRWW